MKNINRLFFRRFNDRRSHARIPMSGKLFWRSGMAAGVADVIDLSPTGASLKIDKNHLSMLDDDISLDMPLEEDMRWNITDEGAVVRSCEFDPEHVSVGIEFSETDES